MLATALAVAVGGVGSTVAAATGRRAAAFVLFGLAAGLVLATAAREWRRQRRANPHAFVARQVLASFYEQQRPSPVAHLLAVLAVVAGLLAVRNGAGPALSRREGALLVVERLAAGEPLPAIDPANVAWGVVLLVGVVLLSEGLDRLLVGGYRELRYRQERYRLSSR